MLLKIFYFFKAFFVMWTILKVFIEFVTVLLLLYVLDFWLGGMWDLSFPTREQTHTQPLHWKVDRQGRP